MEANELMHGDIILYEYDGQKFPARVIEIYRNSVFVESIDGEYEPIEIEEDKIFPIPLTPEILEKNGWMKVEVDGVFYPKQLKGELPWIGYATNGDSWKFRVRDFCEIKYVHQLQNALRLCGIEHEITL